MVFHFLSVREMDGTERESGTNTEGDSCYNLKQTFFCTFYPAPLSYLIVLLLQTMNPDHCKKKKISKFGPQKVKLTSLKQ